MSDAEDLHIDTLYDEIIALKKRIKRFEVIERAAIGVIANYHDKNVGVALEALSMSYLIDALAQPPEDV